MEYRTRDNQSIRANDGQDRLLSLLYQSRPGRLLVGGLIRPWVSELGGRLLSTKLSRILIPSFIQKNGIDMSQYERVRYRSYNDFFTRRVREGMRPFDMEPQHLVSPCDGKLTACAITREGLLGIKGTAYTVRSLLRDGRLAERYMCGVALVFRLTVDDYHHFFYIDDGVRSGFRTIPGVYHTVNPAANAVCPIYKENHREYCLLRTVQFGTVLVMEVGALMVGRIVNRHGTIRVKRGMEKGYFEFGGSTVVLLFEEGRVRPDEDIIHHSAEGFETVVRAGERIGVRKETAANENQDRRNP